MLHNKDQQDALFFWIYFNNHPLLISNRLTIHHQEVALLYVQHVVFITHLRWLAASTIGVKHLFSWFISIITYSSSGGSFTVHAEYGICHVSLTSCWHDRSGPPHAAHTVKLPSDDQQLIYLKHVEGD